MQKHQISRPAVDQVKEASQVGQSLGSLEQVQLALDALGRMEHVALTDASITERNTFTLATELKLALQAIKTGYDLHLNGIHFPGARFIGTAKDHIGYIAHSMSYGRSAEERAAGKLIRKAAASLELACARAPNLKGHGGDLQLIPDLLVETARDILKAANVLGLD